MNQNYQLAENLYQKFVKPLEGKHKGEYVAVSEKGKTTLGPTILEVLHKANTDFDKQTPFVFKVGQKVIGKWL
jgi:Family of unknown function (DUF5678)